MLHIHEGSSIATDDHSCKLSGRHGGNAGKNERKCRSNERACPRFMRLSRAMDAGGDKRRSK